MRVMWRDDRERFLRALTTPMRHRVRRRAAMMILYDSGCRVSELVALNVDDYDRQRKSLLITNVKVAGHPRREVPLHHKTASAIHAWLRDRPVVGTDALFVSQKGNRLSVRQLQDDYRAVCGVAGVIPQGIHTLRHTAATRWLDDRVLEIHQVSRRLGHRSTTTTYAYYVHGSVEAEAEAIAGSRL